MSYTNWLDVPTVHVHAWSTWAHASSMAKLLNRLRSVQFSVAERRIQAFKELDSLHTDRTIVTEGPRRTSRFPEMYCMLNLDDPEFAFIINRMRSDLDCQNTLEAAAKRSDLTAKETMQMYNEGVKRFCEDLNALQKYIYSPKNVWNREKYEKHYSLKWVPQ